MSISRADLIRRAQDALGGLERLADVRTFEAHAKRRRWDGGSSIVSTWRSAGGNVRVDETIGSRTMVRMVREGSGDADLLRAARIAPRNMLAHADEHDLTVREHAAQDGSRLVSFPSEFVLYVIHPDTWLCTLVIDLLQNRRVELGEYRIVDGIATPFLERHIVDGPVRNYDDEYVAVSYNGELPTGIFEHL